MPRFVRRHDNGNIEIFAFTGTSVVGRSRRAAVVIDDVSVSSTHARIEEAPDGFWVVDLDSRNGTRVNNNEVKEKAKLSPGDQVRFGKILVTFENDDGDIPKPAVEPRATDVPPLLPAGITGQVPIAAVRRAEEAPARAAERAKEAAPAVAVAAPPAPVPAPAAPPAPAPAPVAPQRPAPEPEKPRDAAVREAVARAKSGGGEADMKVRVLKDQIKLLQNQRMILAALTCGLALTTVIFLIAFLIYRTKALELEHGIGRPKPADEAAPE